MNRLIGLIVLTLLPVLSMAHGYWLDVKGSGKVNEPIQVQLCHGEIDDNSIRHRETGKELAEMAHFTLYVLTNGGDRIDLTLQPRNDCWEASFTPKLAGTYRILGINEELPVVDRTGKDAPNVRSIQYVCAAYNVGNEKPANTPRQFLDITTARMGKVVRVYAFKDKHPVTANTKLRIFNPENWEKTPTTNSLGETSFMPTMKGLYIIRLDWNDSKPGTYKGLFYESIRHRCDYSLWVD